MGFRLIDVTALPQSIRISCVKKNKTKQNKNIKLETISDLTIVN